MKIEGILGAGNAVVGEQADGGEAMIDAELFAAVLAEQSPNLEAETEEPTEEEIEEGVEADAAATIPSFEGEELVELAPMIVENEQAIAQPVVVPDAPTMEAPVTRDLPEVALRAQTQRVAIAPPEVEQAASEPDELPEVEVEAADVETPKKDVGRPQTDSAKPVEREASVPADAPKADELDVVEAAPKEAAPVAQGEDPGFVREAAVAVRLPSAKATKSEKTDKPAAKHAKADAKTPVEPKPTLDVAPTRAPERVPEPDAAAVKAQPTVAKEREKIDTPKAAPRATVKNEVAEPLDVEAPEALGPKDKAEVVAEVKRELTPTPRPTSSGPRVAAKQVDVGNEHVETHRQLDAMVRGRRQRAATSAVNQMTLRHAASAEIEVPDLGHIRIDARTIAGEVDVDVRAVDTSTASVLQSVSASLESELRNTSIELRNLDIREESGQSPGDRAAAQHDESGQRREQREPGERAPIFEAPPQTGAVAGRVRIVL